MSAILYSVLKMTTMDGPLLNTTRFRCCPQYVPMRGANVSDPSYILTWSKGQLGEERVEYSNVKSIDFMTWTLDMLFVIGINFYEINLTFNAR